MAVKNAKLNLVDPVKVVRKEERINEAVVR
jgi:hypothetical protein